LPPLPVAIPLAIAALLAGLNHFIKRRLSWAIAVLAAAANLGICIELLLQSKTNTIVYWFGSWQPRHGVALGISFVIDPIGAGLACVACALTLAALLFSSRYFDSTGTLFHVLTLVFLGAMCGFALTGDLFNLFVFFELMSAAAYGLCGYKTEEPGPVQGALNFGVTNTVGCYFMLTGIGLVYARTGALNLAQIGRALDRGPADALVIVAFTFITCGFLVKAAVAPFHFWLDDAHAVAPTPVCVLFSGIMVELGLYAVARVYWAAFSGCFSASTANLRLLFIVMGTATALIGAGMCFEQRNLKRLLAFSTISHMGIMVIGFGLLTVDGLAGTAYYMLGHAGAKSGLFLCAGIVLHRCQSVDELELKGKTSHLPFTILLLVCGAAALAGTPLSGIAAGDSMIHAAAVSQHYGWIAWISFASGLLTSAAVFRFAARTYANLGPDAPNRPEEIQKTPEKPDTNQGHQHTPAVMFVPAALLTFGGLFLAITPGIARVLASTAQQFEDHHGYIHRVLDNAPSPIAATGVIPHQELPMDLLVVAAAIGFTLVYLLWKPGRHSVRALAKLVRIVRDAHSGHVGDYVAWLVFGIAGFGLAALFLVQQ
jgi:multicomponent Na+:H+ antiporter subunit D